MWKKTSVVLSVLLIAPSLFAQGWYYAAASAGGGGSPPAQQQSPVTDNIASGTSDTLAYGSSVSSGNFLVLGCRVGDAGAEKTISVSDSVNGSWTRACSRYVASHGQVEIWFFANSGAGTPTVTLSFGGGATSIRYSIHAYTGVATSSPLDQQTTATAENGLIDPGDLTTTQASELLFSVCGTNSAEDLTAGSSWTHLASVPADPSARYGAQHRIVSSTGTYSGEWQTTLGVASWVAAYATFKGQ